MRRISLALATALALSASMFAAAAAQAPTIDSLIDREYASLESLYQTLHRNPELSYFEDKTSTRVADELRKAGFEVTEKFGGTPTRSSRPTGSLP